MKENFSLRKIKNDIKKHGFATVSPLCIHCASEIAEEMLDEFPTAVVSIQGQFGIYALTIVDRDFYLDRDEDK